MNIENIEKLAKLRTSSLSSLDNSCIYNIYNNNFLRHPAYKLYQIIDNKLYVTFDEMFDYESRLEGNKGHFLDLLKKHRLPDMEFIHYDEDSLNTDLPVLVPGCHASRNQLIVPDFMFKWMPEANLFDHHEEMTRVLEAAESTGKDYETWKQRKEEVFYRGSLNNPYRGSYGRLDGEIFDLKHVQCHHAPRGLPNYTIGVTPYACAREEKANYKYLMHLNGGLDEAISGAFRFALACKSLVFYCTSNPYQEWWQHDSIFRDGEHYVRVTSPSDLINKVNCYKQIEEESYRIACNSYEFSKKFLSRDAMQHYYYTFLREYSKKLNYKVTPHPESKLVVSHKKRINAETVIEVQY